MSTQKRSMIYPTPMGPPVRIGVLQHQEVIRLGRLGRYLVRTIDGGMLGQVNAEDGTLEVRRHETTAARVGWRLVLAKKLTVENASHWLGAHHHAFEEKGIVPDVLELGQDLEPYPEPVTAREYWIVSQPFESEDAARDARARQTNPGRIALLAVRLSAPQGTVEVRVGTREPIVVQGGIRIEPAEGPEQRVIIHDVVVGVGFHWQHLEDQKLRGALEVRIDNRGTLTAINELPLEEYLFSVCASEMMSQCPTALLEAQTIAARNTLLATMDKHHHADDFDVCADDHCQCYRGSTRETEQARKAVLNTLGEVLVHERHVCDCRYSKICGGISEDADSVWDMDPTAYMVAVWDGKDAEGDEAGELMPAMTEAAAEKFIHSHPDVFCNTKHAHDVPQYLKYSADYFRWKVEFTREEFEKSLSRFPHLRVGELKDLKVLQRGKSARIESIRIIGSEREVVLGREYHIREAFAPFFLYSSAFLPKLERDGAGRVTKVVLEGAGWGHGAGLCQIGASMMAERGYSCGAILSHYYKDTTIGRLWRFGADLPAILRRERKVGDLRIGDRCYEYYNCYAAARCPVYKDAIALRAHPTTPNAHAAGGNAPTPPEGIPITVEFQQHPASGKKAVDLEALKLTCCEFLEFEGANAKPKSGVK